MIRFGVNYVPRKEWFFSWNHPDLRAAEEDFGAIRELGLDHIRLHLRWDVFQYADHAADPACPEVLRALLDLAHGAGLAVQVTVFNGWMSGVWFLPAFLRGRHVITDPGAREAERFLLNELAARIADHPALLGIDLGNEINVYDFLQKPFSTEEGDDWLEEMLGLCETLFPGKFHVVGVDHNPWFGRQGFSRRRLASAGRATSLHTWVGFTGALQAFGNLSPETLSLAEYNIEFANAYAEDPRRPVWIQEFGAPLPWYREEEAEQYLRGTVLAAMRSRNLWGFTWWCSHDIDRKFDMFEPLEYDLGLFDTHNRAKPIGRAVQRCIADIRAGLRPETLPAEHAIVIEEEKVRGLGYLELYAKLLRRGEHAVFVTEERSRESAPEGVPHRLLRLGDL